MTHDWVKPELGNTKNVMNLIPEFYFLKIGNLGWPKHNGTNDSCLVSSDKQFGITVIREV